MAKHRKKRIAFFALAIVMLAAVGVLVLVVEARSAPHKFMSGATATSVIFNKAPSAPKSSRHYELKADFNNVAKAAKEELTAAEGWRSSPAITTRLGSQIMRIERGKDAITIMAFPHRPGLVSFVFSRPPTLGDRFAWLISGTKTFPP